MYAKKVKHAARVGVFLTTTVSAVASLNTHSHTKSLTEVLYLLYHETTLKT
jgi:hypothetical protein